ncbi:MAG TPA: hypothetical protein HA252_05215 [Candidatus Diapherotrites archaeon]|uniref:DUF7343 domain-containing protein n=1 Tax=Candidatus Iainarchaeum sp. TaxID=3101447 RepID=A0A7J4JIV0_9ARCH|nr:hypothetical protein [Candidatus Diapherotrites archaeon]HIH16780.1 hypothetical protein [Candidatus Diapherotrites archaeon]
MRGAISAGTLALVFLLAAEASAATIHGNVFEWHSLEPLNNVVIDVNSTPPQRVVSRDGAYSFELPPGTYSLRAEFYENGELKYVSEDRLRIQGEGRFIYDLILLPPLEGLDGTLDATELEPTLEANDFAAPQPATTWTPEKFREFLFWAVLAILVLSAFVEQAALLKFLAEEKEKFLRWQRQRAELIEQEHAKPVVSPAERQAIASEAGQSPALDAYAREVLDTLRRCGNRLTQKELRDKLPSVSEAKISLIVSELESMGRVKKIKQGRGNIVVLREGN